MLRLVYIASRREDAITNAANHYSHDHPGSKGDIIPYPPPNSNPDSRIQADVTSKDSIEELVREISKREKYIDLLLNAAGIAGPKAAPKHDDGNLLPRLC